MAISRGKEMSDRVNSDLNNHLDDEEAAQRKYESIKADIPALALDKFIKTITPANESFMEVMGGEGFTQGRLMMIASQVRCATDGQNPELNQYHLAHIGQHVVDALKAHIMEGCKKAAEEELMQL